MALVAAGSAFALAGVGFGIAGWAGQRNAQARWDQNEATQQATGANWSLRLAFPAQNKSFIVRDGATETNLLLGPARAEWSGVPGTVGNTIIAAHRDTHFRVLKDVRKNEVISVRREDGRTFRYRIVKLQIVSAEDDEFYQATSRDVLTLVTCYPFYYLGPAPKRFIVRAELLDATS